MDKVIYRLKQVFGRPLDFYTRTGDTVDLGTGVKAITRLKVHIKLAVVLPNTSQWKSEFEKLLRRSDPMFPHASFVEGKSLIGIVDKKDVKKQNLSIGDYTIYEQERYEIKKTIDYKEFLVIDLQQTAGVELSQIIDQSIQDKFLILSQFDSV